MRRRQAAPGAWEGPDETALGDRHRAGDPRGAARHSVRGTATRFTDHTVGIFCDGWRPRAAAASSSSRRTCPTSSARTPSSTTGRPASRTAEPDLFRDFEQPPDVTWNGSVLAGSIPLIDEHRRPGGAGDVLRHPHAIRRSVPVRRRVPRRQPAVTSSAASASRWTRAAPWSSAARHSRSRLLRRGDDRQRLPDEPRSFVSHFSDRGVGCELTNAAGDTGFLFTSLKEGEVFIDARHLRRRLHRDRGLRQRHPDRRGARRDLEIYDPRPASPSMRGGTIHLEIVRHRRAVRVPDQERDVPRWSARGVTLDLEGTLTIGRWCSTWARASGSTARPRRSSTFPKGPKPGGKVPANDLPGGAKLLTVGSKTSVATKGASPDREAPFECLTFEEDGEVFEVPVAHTVWYQIVGTGGPVTVDTAGSDYDTVIAVYTADGGGFTPCRTRASTTCRRAGRADAPGRGDLRHRRRHDVLRPDRRLPAVVPVRQPPGRRALTPPESRRRRADPSGGPRFQVPQANAK